MVPCAESGSPEGEISRPTLISFCVRSVTNNFPMALHQEDWLLPVERSGLWKYRRLPQFCDDAAGEAHGVLEIDIAQSVDESDLAECLLVFYVSGVPHR
jgi:hypothetical protein